MDAAGPGQRVDRWLWVARFFKTRSLAKAALTAGHVHINGVQAKPSKTLKVGDCLQFRRGGYRYELTVMRLQPRRVSAQTAQTLYRETLESIEQRQHQVDLARAERASRPGPPRRPDKHARGRIRQFKRGE